jgi:hypothetical protein
MEKKDLDKRERALTTLTKDHEVADLAARYFDSKHPLPAVCVLSLFTFFYLIIVCLATLGLFSFRITNPLFLALLPQREGPFKMCMFPLPPKPPRLRTAKMEMKAKIQWKGPARRCRLLLRFLKILALTRRGNVSRSSLLRVPPLTKL